MLTRLPEFIDPVVLAERKAHLAGAITIKGFERVEALLPDDGHLQVELWFFKQNGLAVLEGTIKGMLDLKCQRCLEPVIWPIDCKISLGVITNSSQESKLPKGFEPLLLAEQEKISLRTIIEDELLLNIPDIPKHTENCSMAYMAFIDKPQLPQNNNPKKNPFAILADLNKLESLNGSTKK